MEPEPGVAVQSAEASFVIDDQQRIVEWTGGTAELLGASAKTVVGRPCHELGLLFLAMALGQLLRR
jgi:PAS domain-containing protein